MESLLSSQVDEREKEITQLWLHIFYTRKESLTSNVIMSVSLIALVSKVVDIAGGTIETTKGVVNTVKGLIPEIEQRATKKDAKIAARQESLRQMQKLFASINDKARKRWFRDNDPP